MIETAAIIYITGMFFTAVFIFLIVEEWERSLVVGRITFFIVFWPLFIMFGLASILAELIRRRK